MKKAKVRTMYMIPIRLWSVVVIQDVQPRGSGRASWAAICGTGVVVEGALTVAAMDQGVVFSNCLRWMAAALSAALIWALRCASHASKCCGVMATTLAIMFAWLRPHHSAHWPLNMWPASRPGILNHVWLV